MGDSEDGWDAIEHAIAEYNFRDGAVPVLAVVQGDEGRTFLNDSLTGVGIRAAMQSKNVILNSVVAGQLLVNGSPPTEEPQEPLSQPPGAQFDWAPIFDLTKYEDSVGEFDDIYVLGVEADAADGYRDFQHEYHAFNTDTNTVPSTLPETESDALQVSFNGSNTGATGMVGTGKSILIGLDVAGGIGGQTGDANDYRAKSIAFTPVDMSGASVQALNTAISFTFPFFGETETQLWVREDGTISFSDGSPSVPIDPGADNADLSRTPQSGEPSRPTDPTIAMLWDDLEEATSTGFDGRILRKSADFDGDSETDLAIQWTEYRYANDNSTNDPIEFQAVLYGDGRIQFNYLDLDSYPSYDNDQTTKETGGISATVGIWSGSADEITLNSEKFVPGPHSVFTDTSGETADSYIRMAWDTGGAAWDIGLVDRFGLTSAEANALRDTFIDSLAGQILRADVAGRVYQNEQVLLALNLGEDTSVIEGFAPDDGTYTDDSGATGSNAVSASATINTSSNSIPNVSFFPPTKAHDVFLTARTAESSQSDVHLSIHALDIGSGVTAMPNGSYIVELFFAETQSSTLEDRRVIDVKLEGEVLLNDYDIFADHAKIESFDADELDSVEAEDFTGFVKRFYVDVSDAAGAGLQVELQREGGIFDPILNGIRIIDNGPPRVEDIIISGSGSEHIPYSFADAFAEGIHEFATMPIAGADTVQIVFSEWVDAEKTDLWLYGGYTQTTYTANPGDFTFNFDDETLTATWQFDPFPADQLAIGLNIYNAYVADAAGNVLDGEWLYPLSVVDDHQTSFPSGNGVPMGSFIFTFVYLPGDYNGDNVVNAADYVLWRNNEDEDGVDSMFWGDGDGDGDVDADDYQIWMSNYGLNFTAWN